MTTPEAKAREIAVLAPAPDTKEDWKARRAISDVVRKVVVNAAIHRPSADLIEEVYVAGLYHGVMLSGPAPRTPDYLDLKPATKPRGRPRKAAQ